MKLLAAMLVGALAFIGMVLCGSGAAARDLGGLDVLICCAVAGAVVGAVFRVVEFP